MLFQFQHLFWVKMNKYKKLESANIESCDLIFTWGMISISKKNNKVFDVYQVFLFECIKQMDFCVGQDFIITKQDIQKEKYIFYYTKQILLKKYLVISLSNIAFELATFLFSNNTFRWREYNSSEKLFHTFFYTLKTETFHTSQQTNQQTERQTRVRFYRTNTEYENFTENTHSHTRTITAWVFELFTIVNLRIDFDFTIINT